MQFYEGQLFRKLSNYICNDVNGLPSRVMPVASFVVKRLKHPAKNLGPILGPSHFGSEQKYVIVIPWVVRLYVEIIHEL